MVGAPSREDDNVSLFGEHERCNRLGPRNIREKGVSGERQMDRSAIVGNVNVVTADSKVENGIDQYRTTHKHTSPWCRANKRVMGQARRSIGQIATRYSGRTGRISLFKGRFPQETTSALCLLSWVAA